MSSFPETAACDRPFLSSCLPPLQSESKCEAFVMVISSTLHMNLHIKEKLCTLTRFEEEADMNSEMAY